MWRILESHHQKKSIFLVAAKVVAHLGTDGGHPAGEVAIDEIALVLEHLAFELVWLLSLK